ncbi:hypothetical protein ACFX1Q_028610 [Malus domestica]|uniref:Uncharacterized protein n=1 Tax=Malus domestica TaxID=3750 RepID=A0A498KAM4_MALDO|nr:hypothetical protein DVH24_006647 [Malus domestica]
MTSEVDLEHHSPDARPLMSNAVQMLEGNKEIAPSPFPFDHFQSPQQHLTQHSGMKQQMKTIVLISSTKPSEESERQYNNVVQNKHEI